MILRDPVTHPGLVHRAVMLLTPAGGALNETVSGTGTALTLALSAGGKPMVAWRGTGGAPLVAVYDGGTWTRMGEYLSDGTLELLSGPGSVAAPILRVNSSGQPFVCWTSRASSSDPLFRTLVSAWSAGGWVRISNGLVTGNGTVVQTYGMTTDRLGRALVINSELPSGSLGTAPVTLVSYGWSGVSWSTALPSVPLGGSIPYTISVEVDPAGRSVVAWSDRVNRSVPVLRFTP